MVTQGIRTDVPLHEREIERAKLARELHDTLCHPSDDVLKNGLQNNLYTGVDLVPKDLDNAYKLLGKCPACIEGKIKEPVHPSSKAFQTDVVGEVLYGDLKQSKTLCLSGHNQMLIFRDYYSGYITVTGMKDKSTPSILDGCNTIIAFYSSHGHKVLRIVFDHESVLKCTINKIPNVLVSLTPAGLHNRFVERAIQDLLQRKRCMEADLPYMLSERLEILMMNHAAHASNRLPNERTGPTTTPYMLVTGKRAEVPPYKFGQALVAYIRMPGKARKVEYVMFIQQLSTGHYLCYNPMTGNILSRQQVVRSDAYPKDWNVTPRPSMVITPTIDYVPDPKYNTVAIDTNIQPTSTNIEAEYPESQASFQDTSTSIPQVVNPVPNDIQFPSIIHLIPSLESINNSNISQQGTIDNNNQSEAAPSISITEHTVTPEAAPPVLTFQPTSRQIQTPTRNISINPVMSGRAQRIRKPNSLIYNDNHITNMADIKPISHFVNATTTTTKPIVDSVNIMRNKLYNMPLAYQAFRISMKQAMSDSDPTRVESANKAMYDEMKQLIDMGTLLPTPINQMPVQHRGSIIPSFMFFKEKFRADGAFDKWKARLVAGGNFVDTSLAGDISAQVVNPTSVMTMLSVAAFRGYDIMTADVKGAFLIPELSAEPSELTYIRIDKKLSEIIIKVKPEWTRLRNSDGTFTMRLKKALYGLPVSAHKWMTHLNETLGRLGFQVTDADKCCFTRGTGDDMLLLCSHVDDLLIVGKNNALLKFKEEITKEYDINIEQGYKHSYIGLDIKKNRASGVICIGQAGYKRQVLKRFEHLLSEVRYDGKLPCSQDILDEPDPNDEAVDRSDYLSIVMSIMYLSRFTRPDLAFATAMLSTHCSDPRYSHYRQAIKLLIYIATSQDYVIVYKPVAPIPEIYCDASHVTHYDGKGHGCIIIKIGSGMTFVRSFKLKMITLSSTESEYIVLCEAATIAEWLKSLLASFGINLRPILVRQDNTSAIWLAEHGANFARTKHLLVKKNKAKEAILNGIIHVKFTPTECMIADLGTKPLSYRMLLLHLKNCGLFIPVINDGTLVNLNNIQVPAAHIQRKPAQSESIANVPITQSKIASKKK